MLNFKQLILGVVEDSQFLKKVLILKLNNSGNNNDGNIIFQIPQSAIIIINLQNSKG